ncbi:MAG: hypothetical protein GY770_13415, partial [Aestuariibacter sp.]|nr:hypothetical protein [Aestuariibacter sp.]
MREKIEMLESQRPLLGDEVVEAAIAVLQRQLDREAPATKDESAGQPGEAFNQTVGRYLAAAQPQLDEAPYRKLLLDYLTHILTAHHALNLRGIRTERALTLELEKVYITLSAANPDQERQTARTRSETAPPNMTEDQT